MGEITQTRRVKLRLPQLIQDFQYALATEDYEECKSLKEYLYSEYDKFNPRLKEAFTGYLRSYLKDHDIGNIRDLNGLFDRVFQEELELKNAKLN